MSRIYDIADEYVERHAALDPITATAVGVAGHDDELTDYSADGAAARTSLARDTIALLDACEPADDRDRIAREVMRERLDLEVVEFEAGERLRDLRVLGSPMGDIRGCFDLMRYETADDWELAAARMSRVRGALTTFRASLEAGAAQELVAARRQALACARQAETWGGLVDGTTPFFRTIAARYHESNNEALGAHVDAAADDATAAYAEFARWLHDVYAPLASDRDPVGAERYGLLARGFCGMELNLAETYEWGWEELFRIEHAMQEVGERILPGATLPEVVAHLEADPHRAIDGVDRFQGWLQDLIDRTIAELDGTHFDLAEPIRRCQAMIAPPGGAAAMYYTGPSEDFSRPGRTWYPTLGKTHFPLWREVSICYHEAVPGHHLQIAQVRYLAAELSRFQRTSGFVSGHGEGWALYAERLMGELGYLDDPAFELGMLSAQAMRAVRVIVDIGMHLELPIPARERFHPGERWTPEIALPFVIERSCFPENFMTSEVDRYLGLPGQAISYKVGERVWLAAARRRRTPQGLGLRPQGVPLVRPRPRWDGSRSTATGASPLLTSAFARARSAALSYDPAMPSASAPELLGFTQESFTHGDTTHAVYRTGTGPAVVVIHEVPGITPRVAAFGTRVAEAGFSAVLPSLFGEPGRPMSVPYVLRSITHGCVSHEFAAFATRTTSPITVWLRALARAEHARCGGPGVGAVGMCFTGGFALAMMVDDEMLAPVLSQPSLPFPIGKQHRADLGISDADLATVKARAADGQCVLGLRFTEDRAVPGARFERLRAELGDRFLSVEIDSSKGNAHGIGRTAHSVLTEHLVDEPGHPTREALDRVLAFFGERLRPSERQNS